MALTPYACPYCGECDDDQYAHFCAEMYEDEDWGDE